MHLLRNLALLLLLWPSVALAAFPQVVSTSVGEQATDSATHVMNIAGLGAITVGNRLTCFGAVDCQAADSQCVTMSVTSGTGWTLAQDFNSNWNNVGFYVTKIADGSDSLTLTSAGTTATQQSTHICVQTSGSYGTVSGTFLPSTGSANFNAPSHTCPGGAADNLFWVVRAGDNTIQLPSCPTGSTYGNLLTSTATNSTGASTGLCRGEITSATSDPANVAMTTEQFVALTLCMEPGTPPTATPTPTPTATPTNTPTPTATPTATPDIIVLNRRRDR